MDYRYGRLLKNSAKYILSFTMLISLFNGCGNRINIPNLDDSKALQKISYKEFAEGTFLIIMNKKLMS